jgi:peptidoglycan/LPS O-acetylase OafA/YrhL
MVINMSETVTRLPAGYRTTFAKIMRVLAMITGTLAVAQFALAGFGAFGSFSDQRNWGPHETLGSVIGGFALLTMIAAIVARPGTRPLVASIVLLVLAGPIQPILADAGKHHGAGWGALHALVGVAILAMCGLAARKIDAGRPSTPTAEA